MLLAGSVTYIRRGPRVGGTAPPNPAAPADHPYGRRDTGCGHRLPQRARLDLVDGCRLGGRCGSVARSIGAPLRRVPERWPRSPRPPCCRTVPPGRSTSQSQTCGSGVHTPCIRHEASCRTSSSSLRSMTASQDIWSPTANPSLVPYATAASNTTYMSSSTSAPTRPDRGLLVDRVERLRHYFPLQGPLTVLERGTARLLRSVSSRSLCSVPARPLHPVSARAGFGS